MKHNTWLIDANIIIGAKNKDKYCMKVLQSAKESSLELITTREVSNEVKGELPDPVYVIPLPPEFDVKSLEFDKETKSYKLPAMPQGMAFNSYAMMASIKKQFGSTTGTREKPSKADESLILAYNAYQYISGIISNDSDLEFILHNSDQSRSDPKIKTARSFVKDGLA